MKNPVSTHRCLSPKKVDTPRALSSGDSWFWRYTLKLAILAAILKPNIRSKEPNIEPNLVSPRGFYLPKRSRITSHVTGCPTVRFNFPKFTFLVLAYLSQPSYVFRGFRHPLTIIVSRPVV